MNPRCSYTVLRRAFAAIALFILLGGCGGGGGGGGDPTPGIGPSGGVATSSDGHASVTVPAGSLGETTALTATPAGNAPAGNIGTAYEFGPAGTTFDQAVTLSIAYDKDALPAGVAESDLRLAKVVNGQWQEIAGSGADTAFGTVTGTTTSFSVYGIIAVAAGEPPSAPQNPSATPGDGAVTVTWDGVAGATSYNLYWSTSAGITPATGTKIAGPTSPYSHTGRSNGTTYYYVVTAVGLGGESTPSAEVSATPDSALSPSCGDGNVDPGEACDDGGESATCDADCTPATCGDGTLNATAGEACDDGNTTDGDGCDASCQEEAALGATFMGLGVLPGGTDSDANAVSADGLVVVGEESNEHEPAPYWREAIRWTSAGGMVGLGYLSTGGSEPDSDAYSTSVDGSVVVGWSDSDPWRTEAFRWTAATGMAGLGVLPGMDTSYAYGVSCDGTVVVGESCRDFDDYCEAFRWTESEGMVRLGVLDAVSGSGANSVSCDSLVVVGWSGNSAFRWTSAGGIEDLGYLSTDVLAYGYADWVSVDGSVVVGESMNADGKEEAFRWTEATGMVGLGFLGGQPESRALAGSADGTVVVGKADGNSPTVAFIWDATHGMRNLQEVLVNDFGLDLTGWTLELASGVSADGLTIVGEGINADGNYEGWVVTLPHYP